MSNFARKFIAVLLALWLPLFSGGALSASVSMQMHHGSCQEADLEAMQDMEYHHALLADDQHGTSCADCGVCHLACSGYFGAPSVKNLEIMQPAFPVTPYEFSFHSITTNPLVPPPLA